MINTATDNPPTLARLVRSVLSDSVDIDVIFEQFNASVRDEINEIVALRDAGESVIPEVSFANLRAHGFSTQQSDLIRRRGCVIVRGTFEESVATQWNSDLETYLRNNNYYADLQKAIDSGDDERTEHPHMLDIYWSRSQLEIRQSRELAELQRHLNGLWTIPDAGRGAFDPELSCTYADRVRARQPGDQTRGLAPHVDSCSMESWFHTDTIARTYGSLLDGRWHRFDAFNAVDRMNTQQKPHTDSCAVFRSYQGWMALTAQGAGCGTLQLVPSSRCVAWMFLNMLQSSMNNDEQVFPLPSEAYLLHSEKHALLIEGLCSLPLLKAGDTVWWHPDAVHGVEQVNNSDIPSSVVYLGIAPDCERNRKYLHSQFSKFDKGLSPPDFPATDIEKNYQDRATPANLTELGAQQMGKLII